MAQDSPQILEQLYKNLLNDYNSQKQTMKANQFLYNTKLCRTNDLNIQIAEAEATLQLLQLEEEDDTLDGQEIMKQLNKRIDCLKTEVQKEEKSFPAVEQQQKEEYSEIMKKLEKSEKYLEQLRAQENDKWSLEKEKIMLEDLNAKIAECDELIQSKFILKEQINDPIAFEKMQNEFEDYISADTKLKNQVQFKTQQEKIARNKVVIEFNKLEALKEKKEELEQEFKALKHHSEEIGSRISAMRKEEKKVNQSIKKNKKLNGIFPVREEIMITEKENQLLEMELVRQQKKLKQIRKINESSSTCEELDILKKEHEEMRNASDLLHKESLKNKKLKETYKKLTEQIQVNEELECRHVAEKRNQLKNHSKKIKEMEEERQTYEQKISSDSNFLFQYIEFSKNEDMKKGEEQKSSKEEKKQQGSVKIQTKKKQKISFKIQDYIKLMVVLGIIMGIVIMIK